MGSQRKTNNNLLDKQYQQTQRDYGQALGTAGNRSNEAWQRGQNAIPGLTDRYANMADTGGFDPGEYSNLFSSVGGGGGAGNLGIDESKFDSALKGYQDFASSGGGLDVAGMQARANSVIPSFYKNLENDMENRRRVNPYSPTFDSERAALTRQAGQQSVENVRNTDLDIADAVNRNKQFGIQGLGSLQQAIQGMQQQGKISAANINESAAGRRQSGQLALINARQQGRLAGLGGLSGMNQDDRNEAYNYLNSQFGGIGNRDTGAVNNITARKGSDWWKNILQAGGAATGSYFGARQ